MHQGVLISRRVIEVSLVIDRHYLTIYLSIYSPLLDHCRYFSFLILYAVGRTPWTGGSARRKAATCTQDSTKHRLKTRRHPCLKWDSNPRS
jgi:hypothetical protein